MRKQAINSAPGLTAQERNSVRETERVVPGNDACIFSEDKNTVTHGEDSSWAQAISARNLESFYHTLTGLCRVKGEILPSVLLSRQHYFFGTTT